MLGLFGDKLQARALASQLSVPVTPGSRGASYATVEAFVREHGLPVMLKATKGGRPSHRAHGARQTPSNLSCERPPQGEAAAVCASCTLRTSCVLPTTGTLHLRLGVPGLRTVGSHCGLWLDTWSHRCASEAETAFGDAAVFVEAYVDRARHVEVQVLGDAAGRVMALGDRDCSVQVRSAQRPDHRERLLLYIN